MYEREISPVEMRPILAPEQHAKSRLTELDKLLDQRTESKDAAIALGLQRAYSLLPSYNIDGPATCDMADALCDLAAHVRDVAPHYVEGSSDPSALLLGEAKDLSCAGQAILVARYLSRAGLPNRILWHSHAMHASNTIPARDNLLIHLDVYDLIFNEDVPIRDENYLHDDRPGVFSYKNTVSDMSANYLSVPDPIYAAAPKTIHPATPGADTMKAWLHLPPEEAASLFIQYEAFHENDKKKTGADTSTPNTQPSTSKAESLASMALTSLDAHYLFTDHVDEDNRDRRSYRAAIQSVALLESLRTSHPNREPYTNAQVYTIFNGLPKESRRIVLDTLTYYRDAINPL